MEWTLVSLASRFGFRRCMAVVMVVGSAGVGSAAIIPNLLPFLDPTGMVANFNTKGPINENPNQNPFFEILGTNGRSCGTCHIAANGMGLSLENIQGRFHRTHGRDPLFADFDGANCPNSPEPSDPAAHSLLLNSGLIRIPIALAASPQFEIRAVHDPYGCALLTDRSTGATTVSVYRRPLPTTNLRFLSTLMFDGRESATLPLNNSATFMNNLIADLKHQSVSATLTHAQAANPPTDAQQTAIVNFELGLFSSQVLDGHAGLLSDRGAKGDPIDLSGQRYYPGINDSLGADPSGDKFNPVAMTLFDVWTNASDYSPRLVSARKDIAAGQAIFNSRSLSITKVRGLNDNAALGKPALIMGNCTTCHDTPNVGNHSLPLPLDISTGHDPAKEPDPAVAVGLAQLSAPDLPVFEITGCPDPFPAPGTTAQPVTIYTTDPGKGLLTGLCSDVNRIKGPILRGLAARAPYFHNGAARNLTELVNFYNQRFQMNLTDQEKSQLIDFLNSL
jgi:cytochrome c peroxidase